MKQKAMLCSSLLQIFYFNFESLILLIMKKYYLQLFILLMMLQSKAQSCIDSSRIDLSTPCPLAFIPTCGCDSFTYGNPCEALYYGGVYSYHIGACGSDSLCSARFDILIQSDTLIISNLSTTSDSITSRIHGELSERKRPGLGEQGIPSM